MATRRELLELLRDELIVRVGEHVESKELPAISRELRMVLAELDAIPEVGSKAPTDEIAQRREERRQRAAAQAEAEA